MKKDIKGEFFKQNEKFILNVVIIISVCCLIASLLPRFSQVKKNEDIVVNYINSVSDTTVGGIFAGSQIIQTFDNIGDINALNIMFSTYDRQNFGQVEVQIKRVSDNNVLYFTMLDISTLQDNEYTRLDIENPIRFSNNEHLLLVINGMDGSDENVVSIQASDTDTYPNGTLEVNGNKLNGDLVFNVETSMPTSQVGYWINVLLITLLIVVAYIIFEIIRTKAYTKLAEKQVVVTIAVVTALSCLGISLLAYDQAIFTAISSETMSHQIREETVGGILPNIQVKQTFIVEKNFTGMSFMVGTYARKNIGELDVVIRQSETGRIVHNVTISLEGLDDGEYKRINFGKTESFSSPTMYEVLITSPVSIQDNVVTLWKSASDSYPAGELYLNGVSQNGDLCFKLFGINGISSIILYWTVALAITIALIATAVYLYLSKVVNKKPGGVKQCTRKNCMTASIIIRLAVKYHMKR